MLGQDAPRTASEMHGFLSAHLARGGGHGLLTEPCPLALSAQGPADWRLQGPSISSANLTGHRSCATWQTPDPLDHGFHRHPQPLSLGRGTPSPTLWGAKAISWGQRGTGPKAKNPVQGHIQVPLTTQLAKSPDLSWPVSGTLQ